MLPLTVNYTKMEKMRYIGNTSKLPKLSSLGKIEG